jgi:hypothetical protein
MKQVTTILQQSVAIQLLPILIREVSGSSTCPERDCLTESFREFAFPDKSGENISKQAMNVYVKIIIYYIRCYTCVSWKTLVVYFTTLSQ